MFLGFPLLQQERALQLNHRSEAVHDSFRPFVQRIITADAEELLQSAAICTYYIIINIPRIYSQSFTGIEGRPRVGCGKVGQIQQTFIHDSQGISHRPAGTLGDGYRIVRFRLQFLCHRDLRNQMTLLRRYTERHHAVHPYRIIIQRLSVRLKKSNMEISIGLHLRSNLNFDPRRTCLAFLLEGLQNPYPIFDTNQRPRLFGRRERNNQLLARLVFRFVGLEGKHGSLVSPRSIPPAFRGSPVEVGQKSCRVLAFFVRSPD